MLKSEIQNQFWITKKTVQRKLGSKEDTSVISSDAELDSKIEVFKSISETCRDLSKIIEQYQERLYILSQEECMFGTFLKEFGKQSKSTGESISNTGKAITYSGQQRMCVRVPLMRLHHEVEVFRTRAVSDTQLTINSMEKERTEYRAALSWIKSCSVELDPDTGKGLDKFRMAQSHVRNAKRIFDGSSLDSVQKIDLLAAARCNMFSHALLSYMTELLEFSKKSSISFEAMTKAFCLNPRYAFCLLKDLSHDEEDNPKEQYTETVDQNQPIFFADENCEEKCGINEHKRDITPKPLHEIDIHQPTELNQILPPFPSSSTIPEPVSVFSNMSSHTDKSEKTPVRNHEVTKNSSPLSEAEIERKKFKSTKSKKFYAFMDFFAELDPLENLNDFDFKLNSNKINSQKT